jgi:hypothetical protein
MAVVVKEVTSLACLLRSIFIFVLTQFFDTPSRFFHIRSFSSTSDNSDGVRGRKFRTVSRPFHVLLLTTISCFYYFHLVIG